MDLRVLILLLGVTVYSIHGAIPKCCTGTSRNIPLKILKRVERCYFQNNDGACDIKALVLLTNKKKYCAHPRLIKEFPQIQRCFSKFSLEPHI
ncbi:hypothetical protein UPYG_G00282460 [Umbra pygmaea]|uniref:Chemokine interleukin-8-like domain-containing protein n=1 Tax=Umbra pygmaea TaxID=75934 RepID=A0ABD0WLD0_UMBPY